MNEKWGRRHVDYLGEIAADDDLDDDDFIEVLEDLIDRAQTAVDAKCSELEDDDEGEDDEDFEL